jgi:hypothetical protein
MPASARLRTGGLEGRAMPFIISRGVGGFLRRLEDEFPD